MKQRQIRNKAGIILLILSLVMSLGSQPLFAQTDNLKDTKWKLTKLNIKTEGEVVKPMKDYFISFADGKLHFNLETNTCFGEYRLTGNDQVELKTLGCTRMCCDGDISDKLDYNGVFSVKQTKKKLKLSSAGKVYVFKKELVAERLSD